MCSIVGQSTGSAGSRLAALVAHSHEVTAQIAELLADPGLAADVAASPVDALAGHVTTLVASADRASAAVTVLTGRVDAHLDRARGAPLARPIGLALAIGEC